MRAVWFLGSVVCGVAICASLAVSDSLQLRNGRHLQGKYIGGTTTTIGFMTGRTVEYLPTSDVLALIFDDNSDPSLGGLQPSPMKGKSAVSRPRLRQVSASESSRQARGGTTASSTR
jgi:hypothetical protein